MKAFWRFGYAHPSAFEFRAAGWRLLFWRVWWFSPRAERRWLEQTGKMWNVATREGETNSELRARILAEVFRPMGKPR